MIQQNNQLVPINMECYSTESRAVFSQCLLKKRNRTVTTEMEYDLKIFDRDAMV